MKLEINAKPYSEKVLVDGTDVSELERGYCGRDSEEANHDSGGKPSSARNGSTCDSANIAITERTRATTATAVVSL